MFMQRIIDLECRRCHGVYQSTDRNQMSIVVNNCFLSICPRCTDEVATLMGFTKEKILDELGGMKRAETENNRLEAIDHGDVCFKCHKPFPHDTPRIRKGNASNIESWHIDCYGN